MYVYQCVHSAIDLFMFSPEDAMVVHDIGHGVEELEHEEEGQHTPARRDTPANVPVPVYN